MVTPPNSIDTERLLLRRPVPEDVPAMFENGRNPEVARFMDWPICTDIGQVAARNAQRQALWDSGEEYYWVITLKPNMPVIGSMCVHVRKHAADFGYIVNAQYWNRGYATEASGAIMRWLEAEPGIQRIWATCDVENLASARVLEKLGLVREGLLRRLTVRPNISELPRDAWMFAKVAGVNNAMHTDAGKPRRDVGRKELNVKKSSAKTVYILVGPKGSGKTFIGNALEDRLGILFIRVEKLLIEYVEKNGLQSNTLPRDGFDIEEHAIASALALRPAVITEATGSSIYFSDFLDRLNKCYQVTLVRVKCPPETCLERVARRPTQDQFAVDDQTLRRINNKAASAEFDWSFEIDNSQNQSVANVVARFADGVRQTSAQQINARDGEYTAPDPQALYIQER
jgi:[ribosomal protein S5]-alanine N-acetyltransferase